MYLAPIICTICGITAR